MGIPRIRVTRKMLTSLIIVGAVAIPCLFTYREMRRLRLNHELIDAIRARRDDRVLALLTEGADGTATERDAQKVTLRDALCRIFDSALHRSQPSFSTSSYHRPALLLLYETGRVENVRSDAPVGGGRPVYAEVIIAPDEGLALKLLAAGAPCNEVDDDRTSLLYLVAQFHHHKVLKRLVLSGAEVNTVDKPFGNSPLMVADAEDSTVLLDRGADVEFRDVSGRTALFTTDVTKAELLLHRGANIEAADQAGTTPLLSACEAGDDDVIACLLAHHASVSHRDHIGSTPFLRSAGSSLLETLRAVIHAGADPRAIDKNGTTALMIAVDNPDGRVLDWMLQQGININARGVNHQTALSAASQRYKELVEGGKPNAIYLIMIQSLIKHGAKKIQTDDYWYGEDGD